jgi:hypothetical protein
MLGLVLLVIGGAYLALLLFLYAYQSRMVYFPSSELAGDPSRLGMAFEDVTLASGPDRLHAWFVPADSGAPVVLFCHGNAGNIADRLEFLEQIHAAGLAVLIFDYAGFGKSTGSPGEDESYRDAEAAYQWLRDRGYADADIIAHGRSLGSAVSAHVARGRSLRAIVLEAAFPSLAAVARIHYPWVPAGLLLRYRYPTAEYLHEARAPIVIVHNRRDEIVPFSLGEEVYRSAPEPKSFVEEGGTHNTVTPIDWRAIAFGDSATTAAD